MKQEVELGLLKLENAEQFCVISDFSLEEDENCALLDYYAASSGNIMVIILPLLIG